MGPAHGHFRAIAQFDLIVAIKQRLQPSNAFQIYDGGAVNTSEIVAQQAAFNSVHCLPRNSNLGADVKARYVELKQAAADRCPRLLGTFVKAPEVQYHHDVYNQFLWNLF